MKNLFSLKKFLTLAGVAKNLSDVMSHPVSEDDVLILMIEGRLTASALAQKVTVWPLVTLTDQDAEYCGSRWKLPDGSTMGINQGETTLLSTLAVLDLPICHENRSFLNIIRPISDYANKQHLLPAGVLIRVPETDEYFIVLGGAKVPVSTCEIIVRTDELIRFQTSIGHNIPEEAMGKRERDTLLKLVVGMAIKGYGYDPAAAKSTIPNEIAKDLTGAGLEISISDDTVRKYLKEAVETVLPRKPRLS